MYLMSLGENVRLELIRGLCNYFYTTLNKPITYTANQTKTKQERLIKMVLVSNLCYSFLVFVSLLYHWRDLF